jgi:hypothetical protein
MIPFLLAAVGGYLIGQSRRDEQYAKGGMADGGGVGYENWQMVVVSKELQKDGGRYHKDRFLVSARNIEEAKEIATKLWNKEFGDTDLSIVNVMSESLYRLKYIDQYADGGMMAKGGGVYSLDYFKNKLEELDPDGNTIVEYDEEKNEWYWEDYKNDVYKDGFESEYDAYDNLLGHLDSSYAKGGYMAKGGVVEHGLRKGDKIVSEMYNIAGVINEDSGEAALVDIETGKREEIK